MNNQPLKLRRVKFSDAAMIFKWRNAAGAASFYRSTVQSNLSEHKNWLKQALADDSRTLLIAEFDGQPVSHLRLDFAGNDRSVAVVSISVDNAFRGKGIGKLSLVAVCKMAANMGVRFVKAELHSQNLASKRLFESCGFRQRESKDKFLQYELDLID